MKHVLLQKSPNKPPTGFRSHGLKLMFAAAFMMFLNFVWVDAQAQSRSVSGQVTDENAEAIPGVNVLLKGTTTGTVTDIDGQYSINVPGDDAVLVFSYVGYVSEEVTVGSRSTIDISLLPDIQTLGEIVVIGYGEQRREAVTGSVASISGEMLRDVPASNITQALQGRLPGVEMSQTSSKPGAEMQIRIRGTRSLTAGNDPLVVLDGIPFAGNIGDINPNDIKSIDILKDASATAIYGSRGANGVILVSTHKGQMGQEARVSYEGYYGMKDVFAKYPMMSGPELAALRDQAGLYTDGLDESRDVDTDWQDLLYRTGTTTNHNLGISGGTGQGAYSFSLGYYLDQAVIPTQQYERMSLRGTLDQEVGKYFRFGVSTNNNYNITQGDQIGLYGVLSMSPLVDPFNDDGTWKRTVSMPLDDNWVYSREILEDVQDRWLSETRGFATYNTIYGEVDIPGIEGLKYRANIGLNYRQENAGAYTGEGINSVNETTVSTASMRNAHTYNWAIENLLTYDRTFNNKHHLNITGLYSAEQNKYYQSRIAGQDIPADQFQFYNIGNALGEITVDPGDQHYELSGLLSWMGRIMYSFDDRYMLSAAMRSDGSSRLTEGRKWHTYPAISVGWNVANEAFMDNIGAINMLKLRAGYGQTSNQAVDAYATLGRLGSRPYNFGDQFETGYFVDEAPSPGLGWEYSTTWNYGLDFVILDHRLSGTIEYYDTRTTDLILRENLPVTSGVDVVYRNVGKTENKGIELSLDGVILDNVNGWTWEAGVNLYSNRNRITALTSDADRDESNWWFVGHPINVIYDYEKIGLWQEDDEHRTILEPGPDALTVGSIRVKYDGEYNEDGTPVRAIGPEDRQIISVDPNFQGGFSTRIGYRGLDLTAVGAFQNGGVLISTLHSASGYLNLLSGRRGNVQVDYWTPENTDAEYPNPAGIRSGDNPKYGSTMGYFDASYLKIRTLSLGYNFAESAWVQNAGFDRLRVYFTVQNPLVMFSPYHSESGLDPETNSYGDENAATTDFYQERLLTVGTNTPSTRNYLLGINLTF